MTQYATTTALALRYRATADAEVDTVLTLPEGQAFDVPDEGPLHEAVAGALADGQVVPLLEHLRTELSSMQEAENTRRAAFVEQAEALADRIASLEQP